MVIVLNDVTKEQTALEDLLQDEQINRTSSTFRSSPTVTISHFSLYIRQGEFALVDLSPLSSSPHSSSSSSSSPHSSLKWVGSGEATTCHIVLLRDAARVGVAHIDSSRAVPRALERVCAALSGTICAYVSGGFTDEKDSSLAISEALVKYFCQSEKRFVVKLWNTMRLNTAVDVNGKPCPIVTDVAFNMETKSLHNSHYLSRGPEMPLRQLLYGSNNGYSTVYNRDTGRIEIPHFVFEKDPRWLSASTLPDHVILQHCSTSPHCEPPTFCQDMREYFAFVATKDSCVVFGADGGTVVYRMGSEGQWMFCENGR